MMLRYDYATPKHYNLKKDCLGDSGGLAWRFTGKKNRCAPPKMCDFAPLEHMKAHYGAPCKLFWRPLQEKSR